MPGLVAFGRRWSAGSDDLFLPSVCLTFIQTICLIFSIIGFVANLEDIKVNESSRISSSSRNRTDADDDETQLIPSGSNNINNCGTSLLYQIISAIFLLSTGIILTLILMIVSLRGSILNDAPRKSAQYIIYILLVVLVSKLAWTIFAVLWIREFYLSCTLSPIKEIIFGLVICTWFVFVSVLITAWCTYDGAGRSWIKMKRYQANMKEFELKYPTYKRSGSRHNRNWRQRKVIRAYQDSWNHRCRFLFCCIHRNDRNRDSFADLARILSEFFRDLDVVPSDVVVALVLLRRLQRLEQCSIIKQKRNNTYEFLSGVPITSRTKFVSMNDPNDSNVLKNVVHFMHYASAAYGWPWYLIPNGLKGLCNLCPNLRCCCGHNELKGVVLEDNCCFCNYAVIPTIFESENFDVIHATYHVDVGQTPFFVVVDYEAQAVVVSIRGTLSLKDVITDLNAEGEILPVEPPKEDWIGHKGIVAAAVYMRTKLLDECIIDRALNHAVERGTQSYRVVIVGHSLGAGTAAILSVLLKNKYSNLHCYAFSPPGGLLSMPVVEYTKEFVTSVVVGKDLVPRIGLSQMEALRADLINAMKKSRKAKWHTLMSGMACCCCIKPEFARPLRLSSAPSLQNEEFLRTRRSLKDLREVTMHENESALSLTVHPPLYPPGRIIHIVRHHPKKDEIKYESLWRRVLKNEPVFQALWTDNTDYGQVLISPGMIDDHMPHQVLRALNRVMNSQGPAKPQRNLCSSSSPLLSSKNSSSPHTEPLSKKLPIPPTTIPSKIEPVPISHSSPSILPLSPPLKKRVILETSFSSVLCSPLNGGGGGSLMNPSPLIGHVDNSEEEENEERTPTNGENGFCHLSWDYVTSLQERLLEREFDTRSDLPPKLPFPYGSSSLSNSLANSIANSIANSLGGTHSGDNSEDDGESSTFREIFGVEWGDDWMAPLASPETLSEISSLSSRATFYLPKDSSPLLVRVRGRGGTSLHRDKNKNTNLHGTHGRSLSCSYAGGGSELSIIESVLNQFKSTATTNPRESFPSPATTPTPLSIAELQKYGFRGAEDGCSEPPSMEEKLILNNDKKSSFTTENEAKCTNSSGKKVSFNLKRKLASKDSGIVSNSSGGEKLEVYEPTYPYFSHQEEYGVSPLNYHHYTYSCESPIDSPEVIFNSPKSLKGTKFLYSDAHGSLEGGREETHH